MAKLQNSRRPFSLEKFLSIEVIGQYVATPPFQTGCESCNLIGQLEVNWLLAGHMEVTT